MEITGTEANALGIFVGINPSPKMHIVGAAAFKGRKTGVSQRGDRLISRLLENGLIDKTGIKGPLGDEYLITPAGRKAWLDHMHSSTVHLSAPNSIN